MDAKSLLGAEVYTPLGKGRVVYVLLDGTCLVAFDHGGGQTFWAEQLFNTYKAGRQVATLVA